MGAAGIAVLEDRLPAGEGPSLGAIESENQHVYGVRVVGARRVGHGSAALPVGVGLTNSQDDQGEVDVRKETRGSRAPQAGAARERFRSRARVHRARLRGPAPSQRGKPLGEACYAANIDGDMVAIKG